MKRLICLLAALAMIFPAIAFSVNVGDETTFEGKVTTKNNEIVMQEITSAPTPPTNHWALYTTSAGLFIEDDAGAATQITAGAGDNTLDNAYDQGGQGAGKKVLVDSGAIEFEVADNSNNGALLLDMDDSTNNPSVLTITNAGSGADITAPSFTLTAGAVSGVSGTFSGALSSAGLASTGVTTLGNGSSTVAINSSVWDISTAGAITGMVTGSFSGDIAFANGSGIQSSTTTAETVVVQGYDVDNTTYRNALTVTNGNTIATAIGTGNETVAVNSTTWDVSTAGAFTGVADITGTAGEAMTITIASDGAADDLNLTVTGATDSSVAIASAGTGDDAIDANASAGGVDIDAVKSVAIGSSENTADAIQIAASAGGIDITATGAADEDLDLTNTNGSTNISGGEAAADAVTIAAGAGGIDITSAATYDIDITATGGRILSVASEAAADQFKVDAQGTVAGYAIVLETTDGGLQINADGAANGDVLVDAGDDLGLTAAGDLNYTITGTVDYNASALTDTRDDYENVAAANVITSAECNKIFFLNDATEFASTLPTSAGMGGCVMRFVVGAAPSGADYTVITGNSLENLIYGMVEVNGASVACAQEDTITFADGAAVKGDWIELTNDNTSWYISGQGAGAGAITCTQAD